MAMSDPLDILLAHNLWATRNILDACAALTDEQFHKRFEIGPGSLHDTTTHILAATQAWGDMLAGREPRPRLEGSRRTVPELLAIFDEIAQDLEGSAKSHPVNGIVSGSRGGKSYSFVRGGVLTHVTTHAMHHRALCLNMLRQLGVAPPLPPSSVVEWMITVDPVT
jgi:uncharacterized damage-inducible protein DinB